MLKVSADATLIGTNSRSPVASSTRTSNFRQALNDSIITRVCLVLPAITFLVVFPYYSKSTSE